MLTIKIEETEIWDPVKREFVNVKPQTLKLEHSLISLRKWEAIWKKPFLNLKFTMDELISYVKCMTTNVVDENIYLCINQKHLKQILEYMNDPMTATVINNKNVNRNKEIVTAELIYYWMVGLQIPFTCEKWHLNQLLTLIEVCAVKNEKPKKMSKSDIYARQRAINARNRAKYHTKG